MSAQHAEKRRHRQFYKKRAPAGSEEHPSGLLTTGFPPADIRHVLLLGNAQAIVKPRSRTHDLRAEFVTPLSPIGFQKRYNSWPCGFTTRLTISFLFINNQKGCALSFRNVLCFMSVGNCCSMSSENLGSEYLNARTNLFGKYWRI